MASERIERKIMEGGEQPREVRVLKIRRVGGERGRVKRIEEGSLISKKRGRRNKR